MKSLLFFFLFFIASASAYEVGVSPAQLQLDRQGHGYVTLINPNPFRIAYALNSSSELSRYDGLIEAESNVRIGVQSPTEGEILVSFGPQLDQVPFGISPQLSVKIVPYRVPTQKGLLVLIGVLGGILLFISLIVLSLRAYGS